MNSARYDKAVRQPLARSRTGSRYLELSITKLERGHERHIKRLQLMLAISALLLVLNGVFVISLQTGLH